MSALYRTRWFDYEARQAADEPSLLKFGRFLKAEMKLQVRHVRPEASAPQRPPELPRRLQRVHAASSPDQPRERKDDKRCGFCARSGYTTSECRTFKGLTYGHGRGLRAARQRLHDHPDQRRNCAKHQSRRAISHAEHRRNCRLQVQECFAAGNLRHSGFCRRGSTGRQRG